MGNVMTLVISIYPSQPLNDPKEAWLSKENELLGKNQRLLPKHYGASYFIAFKYTTSIFNSNTFQGLEKLLNILSLLRSCHSLSLDNPVLSSLYILHGQPPSMFTSALLPGSPP